jgi:hypothetical protein
MQQLSQFIGERLSLSLFPDLPPPPPDSGAEGIRSVRRYYDWQAGLQQAWSYARGRARTEQEREWLDAEYERALAKGPDFARYRGTASFDDGPKIKIDRNDAAKLLHLARTIERNSWAVKKPGKHGGSLGRMALKVLETMLFVVRLTDGRMCPSYTSLARLAQMSRRTVISAIGTLETLGFITVHRRLKRVQTALGFETVQDTNAYEIHPPRGFFGTLAMTLFGGKGWCSNCSANSTPLLSLRGKDARQGMGEPNFEIPNGVFASTG